MRFLTSGALLMSSTLRFDFFNVKTRQTTLEKDSGLYVLHASNRQDGFQAGENVKGKTQSTGNQLF